MKTKLTVKTTHNDLGIVQFTDINQEKCSIQESSKGDGSLWLGVNNARMHLSKDMIKQLLPFMTFFVNENIHLTDQEQFKKLYERQHKKKQVAPRVRKTNWRESKKEKEKSTTCEATESGS